MSNILFFVYVAEVSGLRYVYRFFTVSLSPLSFSV